MLLRLLPLALAVGASVPVGPAQDDAEIEALIAERQQAKADRDYAGADQVRQDLLDQGVVLEDSREGTTWRRG